MRIATTDPATMTAASINKELDHLSEASSRNTQAMIDAGRGRERPTDWVGRNDPLTVEYRALLDRRWMLIAEVERRAGPGMRKLPRGFGPRARGNPATDGEIIASDVQCIIYRHAKTGQYMAHVFGGKETKFRLLHGRQVIAMDDLPGRTGVKMFAIAASLLVRHKDGLPLSEEFE